MENEGVFRTVLRTFVENQVVISHIFWVFSYPFGRWDVNLICSYFVELFNHLQNHVLDVRTISEDELMSFSPRNSRSRAIVFTPSSIYARPLCEYSRVVLHSNLDFCSHIITRWQERYCHDLTPGESSKSFERPNPWLAVLRNVHMTACHPKTQPTFSWPKSAGAGCGWQELPRVAWSCWKIRGLGGAPCQTPPMGKNLG